MAEGSAVSINTISLIISVNIPLPVNHKASIGFRNSFNTIAIITNKAIFLTN